MLLWVLPLIVGGSIVFVFVIVVFVVFVELVAGATVATAVNRVAVCWSFVCAVCPLSL